jgi:hypothetical protein
VALKSDAASEKSKDFCNNICQERTHAAQQDASSFDYFGEVNEREYND